MGWPRRLVFVRHAESEGNIRTVEERAVYDFAPHMYPLTPRGRRQAKITGKYLRKEFPRGFDAYYTSYYPRSIETKEIIYPNAKHYEDPRLAEADRGIWHTLTREQIALHYPGEIERKEKLGLYHYRPFGGENWPDIERRIHSFLGTLNRDYDGQDVFHSCHGHWLILFQRLIDRFSIKEALERYKRGSFNNASVTIYESRMYRGKNRLVCVEENFTPWEGKL